MGWAFRQVKKSTVSLLGTSVALALVTVGLVSQSRAGDGATSSLLVGGWQLSPSLFAGAIYNSNVNQTNPAVGSWGERVTPGLTANLDNGIYKTSLYGLADIQNYANASTNNTVYANAGFSQDYLPTPDLTFRLSGNFTRSLDVFGSSALTPANTFQPTTPFAPVATTIISPQANANPSNQFSGSLSVDKSFGPTFVGLTATVANTQTSNNSASNNSTNATSSNGTTYTITQRTGFNLTPQIYAFVDPSVNWLRSESATQNANGYRVTAGVGTLAVGIWKGEVYGGYQVEKYDVAGTSNSPVLGARILYSPTPIWNFTASVDESFSNTANSTTGPIGSGSRVTSALVSVDYRGLPPDWTTSARFGYVRNAFISTSEIDNGWLAGATIRYEFWRNLGLTLDYQFKSVNSNVALQSFNQQMVSFGVSYKY
jgi:hypothetical protein